MVSNIFHVFTPTWGNDPIWRAYFSSGLKAPTSYLFDGDFGPKETLPRSKRWLFQHLKDMFFCSFKVMFLPPFMVYKSPFVHQHLGHMFCPTTLGKSKSFEKCCCDLLCYLVCFSRMRSTTPMKKIGQPVTPVATADSTWPSSERWAVQPDDLLYRGDEILPILHKVYNRQL